MANYKVMIFVSRNKDNKNIRNFKTREKSFLINENDSFNDHYDAFMQFVENGVEGEHSRAYISVNSRDANRVQAALMHYLLDCPEYDLTHIQGKLASLAMTRENAATKKWMFDFDEDNFVALKNFKEDIEKDGGVIETHYGTPNGYAVVVEKGFDTRELLAKWNKPPHSVTLMKDAMVCVGWEDKK